MSYRHTHRLAIAVERDTNVAPGDRLQLKFNGKSTEGHAISNGELVTVRRLHSDGSLTIEDDRFTVKTLSPQQRLFNRGYGVTSYASQGKTVDTVLFVDAAAAPQRIGTSGMLPSRADGNGSLFSRITKPSFAPASSKAATGVSHWR
jgi:hypothetical protein